MELTNGMKFTTSDSDNDNSYTNNCASNVYGGGRIVVERLRLFQPQRSVREQVFLLAPPDRHESCSTTATADQPNDDASGITAMIIIQLSDMESSCGHLSLRLDT